jgi:hypothetical protein
MSGIVSIYVPTTSFNTTIYVPNSDLTQISLAGTINGLDLPASSTVPSGSQYNCQLSANFSSGSESQTSDLHKKPKFNIKPPQVKGAKSPPKVTLESQVPIGAKKHLYKKPEDVVAKLH